MKNLHLAIALVVSAVAGVVTTFVVASRLGPQFFGQSEVIAASDSDAEASGGVASVDVSVRALKFASDRTRQTAVSTVAVNNP